MFKSPHIWVLLILFAITVLMGITCSPPPPPPEVEEEFQVAVEGKHIIDSHKEFGYGDTQENIHKGVKFLELGMLDDAEIEFKRAIAFDPKFVIAHINLGRTFLAKELYHRALESFETAIKIDPSIAKTHYYQGLAYEKLGMIEQAIQSFRNALELNSNLTEASDKLKTLLGATFEETTPNLGNLFVVSVYSEPTEATVMLNNEFKGTTPLTLKMDLASINQLRVTKDGYTIDHQDLKFNDDKSVELTVVFVQGMQRSSTVITDERGLRLVIDPIHFDFNSSVIKPMSFPTLNKAGDALMNFPHYQVAIEGHTDDVGSNDYNQRLSEQRAQAVADYLGRNFGISGSRFRVAGYGEKMPVADNKTEDGRALNRRTEIIILTGNGY